jgi:RimJ/RimL family protein N-acetyltransferase
MALSITPRGKQPTPPFALYESHIIAGAESTKGEPFLIYAGLSKELVEKLKEKSSDIEDAELAKTSDRERFVSGLYEDWYARKKRTLFALVHEETNELAALVWLGPKPFGRKSAKHLPLEQQTANERSLDSEGWHTLVYRSYPPFRGTGIMKDFAQFAMETYRAWYPDARFWAGIFAENPASAGLAKALGFVEKERNEGEVLLVKE